MTGALLTTALACVPLGGRIYAGPYRMQVVDLDHGEIARMYEDKGEFCYRYQGEDRCWPIPQDAPFWKVLRCQWNHQLPPDLRYWECDRWPKRLLP